MGKPFRKQKKRLLARQKAADQVKDQRGRKRPGSMSSKKSWPIGKRNR